MMVVRDNEAPFQTGRGEEFNDAEKAVARLQEIYAANTAYLRRRFQDFADGEAIDSRIRAR